MVVIGAGVIGLEMGSVYARLGTEVTVVEYLDQITPGMDLEVCKTLQRMLTKQGLKIILGAAVQAAENGGTGATVTYQLRSGGSAPETLQADVVLVATGRRPYTQGLGLEAVGVATTERGQVKVDARLADQRARHLRHRRRRSPGRCSRTRPRTRASRWPRPSPASTAT